MLHRNKELKNMIIQYMVIETDCVMNHEDLDIVVENILKMVDNTIHKTNYNIEYPSVIYD